MSEIAMDKVLTMTEAELEVLQKNIKKRMIKKFIINIATGVVAHFAVSFIVGLLENKKNEQEETED